MQASYLVGGAAQAGAVALALLTLLWLVNPSRGLRPVAVEALRPPFYMTAALVLLFIAQVVCTCIANVIADLAVYPHIPLVWILERLPWSWPESARNVVSFSAFLAYWYAIAYWRVWSVRRSRVDAATILGGPPGA